MENTQNLQVALDWPKIFGFAIGGLSHNKMLAIVVSFLVAFSKNAAIGIKTILYTINKKIAYSCVWETLL